MGQGGAPTGTWETLPDHLKEEAGEAIDPSTLNARLMVRRPGVPEVEIPIDKAEFTIGRVASDVDLVVEDDTVSRKHASLTVDARGYFRLTDLGSINGIGFMGRPTRRLNLVDGDVFSIGKAEFTFRAEMSRDVAQVTPSDDVVAGVPSAAAAAAAAVERLGGVGPAGGAVGGSIPAPRQESVAEPPVPEPRADSAYMDPLADLLTGD